MVRAPATGRPSAHEAPFGTANLQPPWQLEHEVSPRIGARSEEHTSELQSRQYLVCRLLLEKKKTNRRTPRTTRQAVRCSCMQPTSNGSPERETSNRPSVILLGPRVCTWTAAPRQPTTTAT